MEKADRLAEPVGAERLRVVDEAPGASESARRSPARPPTLRRPRLDLRQLHAFVAVAEELHFSRAAERIHMAQSPLSRIIRSVEAAAGVALFVRDKRHVRLTAAGIVLLDGARELLLLAESVEARIASLASDGDAPEANVIHLNRKSRKRCT